MIPGSPGARLREEREARGIGSNELCLLAGIGEGAVSRVEQGKLGTRPSGTIKKLAQALGLNEDWLLYGVGEKHVAPLPDGAAPRIDQDPAWPKIRATVISVAPDLEQHLETLASLRFSYPIDADFALTVARQAQRLSVKSAEKKT